MEIVCSKEKEIAIMAEKIDNIEKNIEEVKQNQKEMSEKLDVFYQTANFTYSTKDELKKEVSRLEISSNFISANWDKIIYMLFLIFVGLLYMKDKI